MNSVSVKHHDVFAPRHELYLPAHKGLRAFLCEVLLNVGRLDSTDEQDTAEVLAQLRGLLLILKSHLKHENAFVHAAMEERRPGSTATTAHDHHGHERTFVQLEQLIAQLEAAPITERAAQVTHLYRQLALFVAENFEHMHVEETDNMQVLWECYSDEELRGVEQRLVAAIPPEQMIVFLRWMLPYMTPAERARMVGGMRQKAPAAVVEHILGMLRQKLSVREWGKLSAALA